MSNFSYPWVIVSLGIRSVRVICVVHVVCRVSARVHVVRGVIYTMHDGCECTPAHTYIRKYRNMGLGHYTYEADSPESTRNVFRARE